VERYDALETKIFLESWGEGRGKKLAEYAFFFLAGAMLCAMPANGLTKIYIDSDLVLGQELYDFLHVVEVRLTAGPISEICFLVYDLILQADFGANIRE
jgi:hypothetical protein